jgi:hypothetical protein
MLYDQKVLKTVTPSRPLINKKWSYLNSAEQSTHTY